MGKLLTIGMATHNDYHGVYFTIQALRINNDFCRSDEVEFIVIDSSEDENHARDIKHFLGAVKNSKYIRYTDTPTSFCKYKVADHAEGKYILILDSHVLLEKDGIKNLLDYYSANEDCKNLVQGPLWYDDLENYSTHFDEVWRGHMYGTWGTNKGAYEKGEPFEILMQGMGLCSFEKKNWPGINQHFIGFGAEEGYISEKFRLNGGKNICLPNLRWNHRFGRPEGVKFRLTLEDRVWNYFIGWLDLYKDPAHPMISQIYNHFRKSLPNGAIEIILNKAINDVDKWQ